MKTIQEQIEVMQHFANGGQVMRRECGDRFVDVTSPVWDWSSCDYDIKPVDPYAELKAAAADPTKQIRLQHNGEYWGSWHDAGWIWVFDANPERYEIRDKPKPMKKVKLLAWFDGNALFWRTEKFTWADGKRVQAEDKEIEVEE